MLYTINIQNTGTGVTNGTPMFLVDSLPAEVDFVNGDANGVAQPGTDAVAVTIGAQSGLSVAPGGIRYSSAATPPTDISDCNAAPTGLVDPAIRHICVQLSGTARPSALYPANAVAVQFRARIR